MSQKFNRRNFVKTSVLSGASTVAAAGISVLTEAVVAEEQKPIITKQQFTDKEDKMEVKHKCKITVLRRELYQDLQKQYLADPKSGKCPFFNDGQEFIVENEDFFRMLNGKFCSEAWDCISRYVYAALQGGSIMRGWTNNEKIMIACCNDGTRPVIFKLERIDE